MKVTIQYTDDRPPVTIVGAELASPRWHDQLDTLGTLDLIVKADKKRFFLNLAGAIGVVLEYEVGDTSTEAAICGVQLSPAERKAAGEIEYIDSGYSRRTLYSGWPSR